MGHLGGVEGAQVSRLCIKSSLVEHRDRRDGRGGSDGNGGKKCGSDPPPTRAGGQDDGSFTNSLKSIIALRIWITRINHR